MDTNGVIGQIARIRERSNLLIENELARRGIKGVVPAHGSVLHFLFAQSEPVPIKAIVSKVGRVKSTVTSILNTLRRHGYIEKTPCDQDSRVTLVALTEKGRRLKKDFYEISTILMDTCYGQMSQEDREQLVRQLAQIEQNMKIL